MKYPMSIHTRFFSLESDSLQPKLLYALVSRVEKSIGSTIRTQPTYSSDQFPHSILKLVEQPLTSPFVIQSRRRALITTWKIDGFCFFAGMSQIEYLVLTSLLALTQLRAMSTDSQIEQDDLLCNRYASCLFARCKTFQDYALVYEKRTACSGCRDFYHFLGVDCELLALLSNR